MVSMNRPPSPDSRRMQPRTIPPYLPRISRQPTDIHSDQSPSTPSTTIPQVFDFESGLPTARPAEPMSPPLEDRDLSPDYLVRTAQASRLRRRGAIRLENAMHADEQQSTPRSERPRRNTGSTVTPLFIRKHDLDTRDTEFAMYCGGIVTTTTASASTFAPSPLPYYDYSGSQPESFPLSNGCGERLHQSVAPSQRLGLWVGNALATSVLAPLDPEFATQDINVDDGYGKFVLCAGDTKCGCFNECVGCTSCGNFVGYQIRPCPRHHPLTNATRLSSFTSPPIYVFDPRATSHSSKRPVPFPLLPPQPSRQSSETQLQSDPTTPLSRGSIPWPIPTESHSGSSGRTDRTWVTTPFSRERPVRTPSYARTSDAMDGSGDESDDYDFPSRRSRVIPSDPAGSHWAPSYAPLRPYDSILENRVQYSHMGMGRDEHDHDEDDDDDDVEREPVIRPSIWTTERFQSGIFVRQRRSRSMSSMPSPPIPATPPVPTASPTSTTFPPSLAWNGGLPTPIPSPTTTTIPPPAVAPSTPTSPPPHPSITMLTRRSSSFYRPWAPSPLSTGSGPLLHAPGPRSALIMRRQAGTAGQVDENDDDGDTEMPPLENENEVSSAQVETHAEEGVAGPGPSAVATSSSTGASSSSSGGEHALDAAGTRICDTVGMR